MKRLNLAIAFVVLTTAVLALTGCRSTSCGSATRHSDYPLDSQVAEFSQPAQFDIAGEFADHTLHQWFFNGRLIDSNSAATLGVTGYDSPHLRIKSVTLADCGFFTYSNQCGEGRKVSRKSSATAQLLVALHPKLQLQARASAMQSGTVVYGTPVGGAGGGGTACPGPYRGYVNYNGSWCFPHGGQASDGNNAGNQVVYYGVPFSNMGCGAIPPSASPYHFNIYFKGAVPPGPYPLKLVFNP
jgi:hypothetical protein